jgi:hypothetical protein
MQKSTAQKFHLILHARGLAVMPPSLLSLNAQPLP